MIASDDSQAKAIKLYHSNIIDGELSSIFDDNQELSAIGIQPRASSSFQNNIVQMTEVEQYLIDSVVY